MSKVSVINAGSDSPYPPLFELELPSTLRSEIGASSDAVFT
jgi:hypothetical protein